MPERSIATLTLPAQGRSWRLTTGGTVVGSDECADIRLSDPRVSGRHAMLAPERGVIRVVDLDSESGTYIGNTRVRDALIEADVTLKLGDSVLVARLERETHELPLSIRTRFGCALGESRAMRQVFALLEQASGTPVTVLLEGESGTGKDVLARALHDESPRRDAPFVVVDCGALPANLVESELFGHERGAFTGAVANREGAFERADGGTLFFDEIGELPLELQPKLLRALESRTFRRVGGSRDLQSNVRVVAATNRPLADAIREKTFREDLYFRLAVIHVRVPRLIERREDIPLLARHFLQRITGEAAPELPRELDRLLATHHFPGNARELRNVIARFAAFGKVHPGLLFGESIGRHEPAVELSELNHLPYHEAKQRTLEALHRTLLPAALERAGGSIPKAAKQLGIPRTSLHRMLQRLSA